VNDQASIIRWEEPPPPAGNGAGRVPGMRPSQYNTIADQLRANPGRWAVVEEIQRQRNNGLATKIAMGHMLCFTPAGDFEAVTRQGGGVVRTYARYLGDEGGAR
jgi:hypothetical protein